MEIALNNEDMPVGWICPVCETVWSPTILMCTKCAIEHENQIDSNLPSKDDVEKSIMELHQWLYRDN